MADDNYDDDFPADHMAGLANAMIILTGIVMLIAIILMWKVTGDLYAEGMMA